MNTYAFNVAPLAGYETQFGAGSAPIAITASGDGKKARLGSASAPITIAATGAAAVAGQNQIAFGTANMVLAMGGNATVGTSAQGSGLIVLSASYGLPKVQPVPSAYYRGPLIRLVDVDADPRVIKVPAVEAGPPRIVKADADPRVIRVPADPTQQGGQA